MDNNESMIEEDLSVNNNLSQKVAELEKFQKEEQDLLSWHSNLKQSLEGLTEHKEFQEHAYITHDDLKKLASDEANFIAVKAQKGTVIEIPKPEHVEKLHKDTVEVIRWIY